MGMTRRQFIAAAPIAVGALALAGCSSDNGGTQGPAPAPSEPLDLTGSWVQVDTEGDAMRHEAVIEGGAITVNWVQDDGTRTLYWAGSYTAPTEPGDTYSWDSSNDTSQTGAALLASGEPTKRFAYEGGRIKYEATVMGATAQVELERA